jgi:hypothetical protein
VVDAVDGSALARRRLKAVLETISGERTVGEASGELGIGEAAFHKLRRHAIEGAMAGLEPRPPGRPRSEDPGADGRVKELEEEILGLKIELRASQIREELALLMPQVLKGRREEKKRR